MKTIKIVLSAVAMLAMVSFSNAQSAEKTAQIEKVESYIQQLELSTEQAVKARELNHKYFDLITNAATPEDKKRLTVEADNEVKKILTEEQYKKYYALKTADENPKQTPRSARIPNQPHPST